MTKKASKKSTRKPRAAQAYELTAKGSSALTNDEFGPQAQLVASTLNKKGSATASQIASAIDNRLKTKQPVVRVVAYYLGEFKRAGQVRVVKTSKKSAGPGPALVA